jgi:hypothetical protein
LNERWENTVFADTAPSLESAHDYMLDFGGLARIICKQETAPLTWHQIRDAANIPSKMAQALYRSAIECGARLSEWRGTLNGVLPTDFIGVKIFDGERWIERENVEKISQAQTHSVLR